MSTRFALRFVVKDLGTHFIEIYYNEVFDTRAAADTFKQRLLSNSIFANDTIVIDELDDAEFSELWICSVQENDDCRSAYGGFSILGKPIYFDQFLATELVIEEINESLRNQHQGCEYQSYVSARHYYDPNRVLSYINFFPKHADGHYVGHYFGTMEDAEDYADSSFDHLKVSKDDRVSVWDCPINW